MLHFLNRFKIVVFIIILLKKIYVDYLSFFKKNIHYEDILTISNLNLMESYNTLT